MQCNVGKFAGVVIWVACAVFIGVAFVTASGQSSDIAFPTALTENQISGVIKARDVGDPRVTTYYYTFNGTQGDLFINVVTKNLSGSVDVFLSDSMRPVSNIIVYADVVQSETGRVIYLRKPEKLILRIQGRTPNDDPAEFQVKFAGGFEAATPSKEEPPVPKVTDVGENDSGVKVNSVGTIIAVMPKPKPSPKATPTVVAKAEQKSEEEVKSGDENVSADRSVQPKAEDKPPKNPEVKIAASEKKEVDSKQPKAVAAKTKTPSKRPTKPKSDETAGAKSAAQPTEPEKKVDTGDAEKRSKPKVVVTDTTAKSEPPAKKEPPAAKPNPLANVRLVILFKDGSKVERPMTEVFRFTADQSTLTVISTNGRTAKYPILDVISVTIQ